jgi:hypothetical protein
MITRSEKEKKDKTRRSSRTTISLSKANIKAMAPGSGTQVAVVARAMMEEGDALPSSLVDPLEGLTKWKCGRSWNLEPLLTSSTKRGKRGVLEVSRLN